MPVCVVIEFWRRVIGECTSPESCFGTTSGNAKVDKLPLDKSQVRSESVLKIPEVPEYLISPKIARDGAIVRRECGRFPVAEFPPKKELLYLYTSDI
jgi:hypothetical protein